MKTLILQEGYHTENYDSLSLLKATYAAETASILIKALQYFIRSLSNFISFQKQDDHYVLIKTAMLNIKQLSIKHTGITGSITIDSDENEFNSTFALYNVITSLEDDNTLHLPQIKAHIFHTESAVYIQYINAGGMNSSKPTIVYADGTTNPPHSIPEQQFITPIIGK